MSRLAAVCSSVALLAVVGCAKSLTNGDAGPEAGSVGEPDSGRVGRRDSGANDAGRRYDAFIDPGCIPNPRPVPPPECEPLGPPTCETGTACYPFTVYPEGSCGQEVYTAACLPAGARRQGDACMDGMECAGGFTCFVTGAGKQCLALCDPSSAVRTCPRGLVCSPTDLGSFGACL